MIKFKKLVLLLLVFLALAPALTFSQAAFNRSETVYGTGGIWSPPSNWNPFQYSGVAFTGTVGLLYEPLFYYNPVTGDFPPCLALSAKWVNANTYEVKLRQGVKWMDGQDFTADDVVFTFTIAKDFNAIIWHHLWETGGLTNVKKVNNDTVNFIFSSPRYQVFSSQVYQIPIVPKHIYNGKTQDQLIADNNANPVGTGPYKHQQALPDRDIYVRNDNWWGKTAFGKLPAAKNIVLLMVNDNSTSLGMLLQGNVDIDNNYTPGVPMLIQNYKVATFYKNPPYHLSWNTTMLYMNTKKAPMNDAAFRRALAFAINSQRICDVNYQGMVLKAEPTGFLPTSTLQSYLDKPALSKFFFKYAPAAAKQMLDAAGYKMAGKFRTDKDGKPISLQINCPVGWSDWEIGIRMIAEDLNAVGINAEAKPVDFNLWQQSRFDNTFDMLLDNNTTLSSSPMNYLDGVANQLFQEKNNTRGNWGQYTNPTLKTLLEQFDKINPATDMDKSKQVMTQIQTIMLQDMPAIPLWYNGMWFIGGQSVWTGYSNEENKLGVSCIWANTWQLGTVHALLNLQPAGK
jgi:peptide/nickel transport system substrate-binding protein